MILAPVESKIYYDGVVVVIAPTMLLGIYSVIGSKIKLYADTGAPVKAYNADAGESS